METNIDHRCGAVLGATILIFAALRFATTILGATSSTSLLVFVLSAMAGELFNPLFFSSFALYSMFFFFYESRLWRVEINFHYYHFYKRPSIYFVKYYLSDPPRSAAGDSGLSLSQD